MKRCMDCKNFLKVEATGKNDCRLPNIMRAVSMRMSIHLEDAEYEVNKWLLNDDDENSCPEFSL